ncbi:MAG: hypothetical protein LUH22_00110 [Bacteroides sp.]|nr:hypothetical protein [Bacteroides sp.]
MKFKAIIAFLFTLLFTQASAQTLEQARKMFSQGDYENAKPVFARFLKSQPNSANYNFWYGVCCVKTNEPEEALKPLRFAVQRKVPNAPLYLGEAYQQLYYFDEAVEAFEEQISALTKKKQDPDKELLAALEKSKQGARMIKGVEDVCFIDSVVIDKENFLQAYRISEESGKLHTFNEYFEQSGDNPGTVYETELGNKIYYSEPGEDGTLNIFTKNKMLDEWSKGSPLPGNINDNNNANYPYVLTDGITIYYAADNENSLGGYDIYVTRYNSGTDNYLVPENVGMPFNSSANDYMYVIDDYNDLGWFATDRNQPEDKVCIYIFIPNNSRQAYNFETMDPAKIRSLAQLQSIRDTWKDMEAVESAQQRLEIVINQKPKQEVEYDFSFIINDQLTYHELSDFTSPDALQQFKLYRQLENDYLQMNKRLEQQRTLFAQSNAAQQAKSTGAILDLEKRVLEIYNELQDMAVKVRNLEIKHRNK